MELLKLSHVSYRYNKMKHSVLQEINRVFETGKLYCITGESGSGKSTLLSLIAGLDLPSSGEILYQGQNTAKMNRDEYRSKTTGVIFQGCHLLQTATAAENVLLAMNIAGKRPVKSAVYDILAQVRIDEEKANRKILKLSGGEQQRVAIARALAGGAPILAADEPTGNLDRENEAMIMGIFQRLAHTSNKCVIVVTHSDQAAACADEVLTLKEGRFSTAKTLPLM